MWKKECGLGRQADLLENHAVESKQDDGGSSVCPLLAASNLCPSFPSDFHPFAESPNLLSIVVKSERRSFQLEEVFLFLPQSILIFLKKIIKDFFHCLVGLQEYEYLPYLPKAQR